MSDDTLDPSVDGDTDAGLGDDSDLDEEELTEDMADDEDDEDDDDDEDDA